MTRSSALRCLPLLLCGVAGACHPSTPGTPDGGPGPIDAGPPDGGPADAGSAEDAGEPDAGPADAGRFDGGPEDAGPADAGPSCSAGSPCSAIEHLVLIVQENHTFDAYFAHYCTAAAGSGPSCTDGPACCEAGPATDPSGASPQVLNDAQNAAFSPNHRQSCEVEEMDDGGMDQFVQGTSCSSPDNLAYADPASVSTYWQLAASGALADRYFQPIAGATSANDMYFARAHFVFLDNSFMTESKGALCAGGVEASYTDPTIADLLIDAGVSFGVYAGGYADAVHASPACGPVPSDCPAQAVGYPCTYDPSDIPFEYYPSLQDNPLYMKDISRLAADLSDGGLPSFSYVKAIGYLTEHPGGGTLISSGEAFVQAVIDSVAASPYAASTLILVTFDEGGGYFDHVPPPPPSPVDGQPYGTRVPMIAVGPFARSNAISHVTLEHSSVVKFIEWNWLGQQTGQLGTRDAVVHNLGSLLDPLATGAVVPP
jgi:phospholipase C